MTIWRKKVTAKRRIRIRNKTQENKYRTRMIRGNQSKRDRRWRRRLMKRKKKGVRKSRG